MSPWSPSRPTNLAEVVDAMKAAPPANSVVPFSSPSRRRSSSRRSWGRASTAIRRAASLSMPALILVGITALYLGVLALVALRFDGTLLP